MGTHRSRGSLGRAARTVGVTVVLAATTLPAAGAGGIEVRGGRIPQAVEGASPRAGAVAVLILPAPLDPAIRADAERLGLRFEASLGRAAWLVRLPADPGFDPTSLPRGARLASYPPHLRWAPELAAVDASFPRSRLPLVIELARGASAAARAAELQAAGFSVGGSDDGTAGEGRAVARPGRIVVLVPPGELDELRRRVATWPETLWVGRRPAYRLHNDNSAWVLQSGLDGGQTSPLYERGLNGEGQVIGILDTGLDADLCYFREQDGTLPPANTGPGVGAPDPARRKVIVVDFLDPDDSPADPTAWDDNGHGTHVAGSAVGDHLASPGTRDPGDGMAPAAKLVVQDGGFRIDDCADLPALGCPVVDLYPLFEQAYLQGARIHSDSWGDRENLLPQAIYSDGSRDADAFVRDHPDFLLLFAAGNAGSGGEQTVGSPSTAKNVISVGASGPGLGAGSVAGFSSRGPTSDGRIKPDLIVPGQGIVSAAGDGDVTTGQCGTRTLNGTSMACATAAGMAALARQYFVDGFYPSGAARPQDSRVPSAALLKATLIASARAMEDEATPPPSPAQGWGRVQLDDVLYLTGDARRSWLVDASEAFVSSGDTDHEHTVEVLPGDEPLSVALVWTDAPSTPAAAAHLVNDLDLELVAPSGALYRGNVFDATGQSSPDTGSADALNNVEIVRLAAPEVGPWQLRVRPAAIPEPPQGYALVVAGRLPAAGPALERIALTPDDTAGGNGDGLLDPGEWIDFPLTVLNSGSDVATAGRVTIATPTPGVELTRPTALVGDLDPGAEAQVPVGALRVRLPQGFPCAEPLEILLTLSADGFSFTETLSFATGTRTAIAGDDFESPTAWAHSPGDSTATNGAWIVGDPDGTPYQPEHDATPDPGVNCLFTASNAGGIADHDVDNGVVVARSGPYDLTGHPEARVSLARWFGNRDTGEDPGDLFRLAIRHDAASPDVLLEQLGSEVSAPLWTTVEFRVADHVAVGAAVELSVHVADAAPLGNIVEGAIDDVLFWEPTCTPFVPDPAPPLPVTDLRLDKSADTLLLEWSRPLAEPEHPPATRYTAYESASPASGFVDLADLEDPSAQLVLPLPGVVPGMPIGFYLVVAGNEAGDAGVVP